MISRLPEVRPRFRLLRFGVALLALALIAGLALAFGPNPRKSALTDWPGGGGRTDLGVTVHPIGIGVADIRGTGWLDVFTTNHGFAPLYALNRGGQGFDTREGPPLDPDAMPTADVWISHTAPETDIPGLHIYWQHGTFHMIAQGLDLTQPAEISLAAGGGILPRTRGGMQVIGHSETGDGLLPTQLDLRLTGDGALELRSLRWWVTGEIALDRAIDLAAVHIGKAGQNPQAHRFALDPGADRHGLAWVDMDGDGLPDVIHVDGGEVGEMLEPQPYDVAFGSADGLSAPRHLPGLMQEMCPSRQVALYDVDSDGLLDVHVICGRGAPPRADHPHELFIQTAPMAFENRADLIGLGGQGQARWFDAGRAPALLWADADEIRVLYRNGTGFQTVFAAPRPGDKAQIAMGDIGGDGWPDFFIASPTGNSAVLRAGPDGYVLAEPETLGLPRHAHCAAFVDHDNDGQQDFHSLPAGLFRLDDAGRFAATGALASGDHPAFCLWFDADNDGFPDLLTAFPTTPPLWQRAQSRAQRSYEGLRYRGQYTGRVYRPQEWELAIHHNRATGNGWASVDLVGPPGNPMGLGARITISTDGQRQSALVGGAEGSTASTGHYRSYFGLGAADAIGELVVLWPDGTRQAIEAPAISRHHVIRHPGADQSQSLLAE